MFETSATKETTKPPDTNKCLVNIQLAGEMHIFYQDIFFVDCLIKAVKTLPEGGFFEFKTCKGGYTINLNCIDYINILEDAYEIQNDDSPGYSVFLVGSKESIKLGMVELSLEQITEKLANQTEQFIRLGSYYFNRDEIALIVSNNMR